MAIPPTIEQVRSFWEANPLSATAIPHEPGTPEFFLAHERMRALEEPPEFQRSVYEWDGFRGKSVLDIGCGTGYVVALYAKGGANVLGVDIAERSVTLTRKRLDWLNLRAKVQQANAEDLPFSDSAFDLVTAYGVLHHTPDTQSAIVETYRVLKPGGRTIMMFYHSDSFAYRILFPLKRWLQPRWRGKTAQEQVNAVDGPGNPLGKVYSRGDLRRMLSQAGFADTKFATGNMFFDKARLIPRPLRTFVERHWGWQLYVKARKPL